MKNENGGGDGVGVRGIIGGIFTTTTIFSFLFGSFSFRRVLPAERSAMRVAGEPVYSGLTPRAANKETERGGIPPGTEHRLRLTRRDSAEH